MKTMPIGMYRAEFICIVAAPRGFKPNGRQKASKLKWLFRVAVGPHQGEMIEQVTGVKFEPGSAGARLACQLQEAVDGYADLKTFSWILYENELVNVWVGAGVNGGPRINVHPTTALPSTRQGRRQG